MCPYEEKLTAWLLGDLSPEEQQDMTCHLEGCAACRAACEELSRVLSPLRSGLEKDSRLNVPAESDVSVCSDAVRRSAVCSGAVRRSADSPASTRPTFWSRLSSTPHEGLKRAAIIALSFGTLFALISVVLPRPQRISGDPNAVTYLSYLQPKEESAPALAPAAEPKADAADKSILAESPAPERIALPAAPVVLPDQPAPEPRAPAFPRIADAEAAREATRKVFAATAAKPAPAPAAPVASASALESAPAQAKREHAKDTARRMSADLQAKPLQRVGYAHAATNAVPTNAVPTNAVMPAVKRKP